MNDVTHPQPRDIYWKQQIQAWKLSNLSQSQFCQDNNLTYHRFVYWRGKFEREPGSKAKRDSGGFAAVDYRQDIGGGGLTLSLPNGLVLRGICADNVPVVCQLLEQL